MGLDYNTAYNIMEAVVSTGLISIGFGAAMWVYHVYNTRHETERIRSIDGALDYFENYAESSKDELTEKGRELIKRRGIEMEASQ